MDSPNEQTPAQATKRRATTATRERLLQAAGQLIAEFGWGRVTTRSVAERAGLPHGAVSYHFSGKQELLSDAAVLVFEQAFPIAELEALGSLEDALALMERWMGEAESGDLLVAEVGVEAILESSRDPVLREQVDALLRSYRAVLAELARREVAAGTSFGGASPQAVATLVAAAADGLFLHARLDPELDSAGAMAALRSLLAR
jgi:AcrR family transcriptional regulator